MSDVPLPLLQCLRLRHLVAIQGGRLHGFVHGQGRPAPRHCLPASVGDQGAAAGGRAAVDLAEVAEVGSVSPASQHSFEGQKTREVGYPMSHVSACAPPGEQVCVRVVLFTRMTAFTRSQKFGGLVQTWTKQLCCAGMRGSGTSLHDTAAVRPSRPSSRTSCFAAQRDRPINLV